MYKQAIVDASADDTELVTDFSVLWPNGPQPARVLLPALQAARDFTGDVVGEVMMFGERKPVPKFAVVPPTADATGSVEAFAMYAGVSAGSINSVEPAADIVTRLAKGAEQLLSAARPVDRT